MTDQRHTTGTHRVQVSFPLGLWKLIEPLKSKMGTSDAEVVRNIVIAWLAEKSFVSSVTIGSLTKDIEG